MQIKNYEFRIEKLSSDILMRRYGERGLPLIVFPPQEGKFTDFEGFGMVDCVSDMVESGRICLYSIDSIDKTSWSNQNMHPSERGKNHELYERMILEEIVPLIKKEQSGEKRLLTCGCSMGGYHAGNFYFKHPDVFTGVVSLSGIMDLSLYVGSYMDEVVYYNSPLTFLRNLEDEYYLGHLRKGTIVICAGLGRWDELMVSQARSIDFVLKELKVPAWVDIWGYDVDHDWPWWRKQLRYFLANILESEKQLDGKTGKKAGANKKSKN